MISAPVSLLMQARGKFIPKLANIYVTISTDQVHLEYFDVGVEPPPGWLRIGTYDSLRQSFTEFMHNPDTHKEKVA